MIAGPARVRWLWQLALLGLAIGIGAWYGGSRMIASLIFFPERTFLEQPERYGLTFEEATPVTTDNVTLHGWYLTAPRPSSGGPAPTTTATVLFLHGNAGNISHRLFKVAPLVKSGVAVLLVDYRGFGQSEGKISRGDNLYADARAAMDWLRERKGIGPDAVTLYGESIGSAPALKLATETTVRGVILEAPFTTLKELGRHHYPLLPAFLANAFAYDNLEQVRQVRTPLLILHGEADEICPHEMGRRVYDEAPGPKQFVSVPGAHHNDLVEVAGPVYFETLIRFLR